jgi:translation initiation factor 2B subunit (eIF-2B alpha/beta/delta family)
VNITKTIADIAADTTTSAVELAERAADVLLQRAQMGAAASPEAFRRELLATGWALIRAQPAMAPIVNLVNQVLWNLESVESPLAMSKAVGEATDTFRRKLRVHEDAIVAAVLPLIHDGAQVLIHGRSTTVRAALRHAQRTGRRFSVICSESRPAYEGRTQAQELAESGIAVTLVTDVLALNLVRESQLVLVGADLLSGAGLVNRVGTYGLSLAASDSQVPIYTLCGSEKFLPPGYQVPEERWWPATQVWKTVPEGIEVKNHYFDTTPLSLITGIVTEKGVLTSEGVEAWLATTRLHPALQDDEEVPA